MKIYYVQFYSFGIQKHVTISVHRKLNIAILKARKSYAEDGYNNVTILDTATGKRLNKYGNELSEEEI